MSGAKKLGLAIVAIVLLIAAFHPHSNDSSTTTTTNPPATAASSDQQTTTRLAVQLQAKVCVLVTDGYSTTSILVALREEGVNVTPDVITLVEEAAANC